MKYCLDTSVCVEIMRQGESFDAIDLALPDCMISPITRFELEYGIHRAPRKLKSLLSARLDALLANVRSLWFDDCAAAEAAAIRYELEKKGTPIGHYDTLIAGHARILQLSVVTGKAREFERVSGLDVISI
ncbi:MAG: PIN domain-containing protein [Opitutales bacterium]